MNASDIAALAQNAGFTGSDVGVAVAIALAESRGDPGAVGDRQLAPAKGPSYGLMQINIGSRAHPEFAGWNLFDPQINMNAAFRIYRDAGGSFREWSTYASGAYLQFLPASTAAPITIDASTGQPVTDSTPTPDATFAPSFLAGESKGQLLLLTAAAAGLYLLADALAD